MSYENSAACKMLATNCLICGRPLIDAISVSLGVGPECRKENDGGIAPVTRDEANKLVHDAAVAAGLGRIAEVLAAADKVEALGLAVLAGKMRRRFKNAERQAEIEIVEVNGMYRVVTPFRRKESEAFVAAWRTIPGRRWNNGANEVPVASRQALYGLLKQFFGGRYAKGPKGVFRIPAEVPALVQGNLNLGAV